jgi:uncharacterized protein (TIGR02145 family)
MAENLKSTKYSNGDLIGTTPSTFSIPYDAKTPKYQWPYDGNEKNATTYGYGRLYTGYAVMDSRNICPSGWHVPYDGEWTTLISTLGGEDIAGDKLRESGTRHWYSPNIGATNETGFTALPGGTRESSGRFGGIGEHGGFWSSTKSPYGGNTTWSVFNSVSFVEKSEGRSMDYGYAVRCIKD